jgi:hypothetical protein
MKKYKNVDEMLMEQELNSKVFKSDPLQKILDPNRNRTDRFNNNYLMELKCRYHSYYAWNLKKIKEPTWYEKMMPRTTNWNNEKIKKVVGDLNFDDATKLI